MHRDTFQPVEVLVATLTVLVFADLLDASNITTGDVGTRPTENFSPNITDVPDVTPGAIDNVTKQIEDTIVPEQLQSRVLLKLLDGYDRTVRPFASSKPVDVHCDMYITSFDSIMETTMDYQVTMYFRQYWTDPRLTYNHSIAIVIADDIRKRFWVPDLFFVNVKQANFHHVTRDNMYFRLHPNGDILYSLRLSLILTCHMDLKQFPMDNQYCGIQIEPYGYTTADMLLHWNESSPVDWDRKMKLAQYELKGFIKSEQNNNLLVTGKFAHVNVEFILTRQLGYYMLQTYIPSIMLVVVSWVSFWVDVNAAPARVALGITTVLTFTTMSSGVSSQLPKVAYAKAIDIWLAACMVFVFAALLEFALANYLHALGQDRQTLSHFFRPQNKMEYEDETSLGGVFTIKETMPNGSGRRSGGQDNNGDIYHIENDHSSRRTFRKHSSYDLPSASNSEAPSQGNRRQNKLKRGSSYKMATALAYQKSESETSLHDSLYTEGLRLKNKAIAIDRYSRYLFPLMFAVFNALYWPLYLTDAVFNK